MACPPGVHTIEILRRGGDSLRKPTEGCMGTYLSHLVHCPAQLHHTHGTYYEQTVYVNVWAGVYVSNIH